MAKDKLRLPSNALSVSSGTSLTPSQLALGTEIHLTALNAKSEPDADLIVEFRRVLESEPGEAIRWAFRNWRDYSPFFPAISDIRERVNLWHRIDREREQREKEAADREALEAARARGELVEFSECVKQLQEIASSHPGPKLLRPHLANPLKPLAGAVANLHLSEEEIQARRDKELKEIERYRQSSDVELA